MEILDTEQPDEELDIPNCILLKKNYIGSKPKNYDGFLVLSHFKGHAMGGFGGALKQLSIGFGSRLCKTLMHCAGKNSVQKNFGIIDVQIKNLKKQWQIVLILY